MQSKTTRGVRHLLVSTGVISLVLSVATPAALADRPDDLPEPGSQHVGGVDTGTDRVVICHNGRLIEVDDDGQLNGHLKHDDAVLGAPESVSEAARESCALDGDPQSGGEFVKLCLDGDLDEILESEVTEGHTDPTASESGVLSCPDGNVTGDAKVEVCHEGTVIEIAAEALEDHLGHGDVEMDADATCPALIVKDKDKDKDKEIDIDPVVVLDDPEVVAEVPVKNPPAAPVQPIPAPRPRPIVNISADTVTKPVVATPAATPKAEQNEVLGAITTRTPTPGVGALDPGAHTAASITALAATGADGTTVLAVVGALLLLSGFGLQASGRRRLRSAVVEA